MITLAIDASTYVADVALLDGRRVLAESNVGMKDPVHERLMPAVAAVLEQGGQSIQTLDRIVCGAGPGSFTSLRIAGGIAKGLAAGAGLPLFAVPSMALIVAGASLSVGRYLAAVDALRGEYYVALYHVSAQGEVIELEPAGLIAADQVTAVAARSDARVVSPSVIDDGLQGSPRASGVVHLGQLLDASEAVDLASWEPAYGRLAEAQVRWESTHGRPLPVG